MKSNPVWKTNNQSQLSLLTPSYDDLIPSNHPVRLVNAILNRIDVSSIEKPIKVAVPLVIIRAYSLKY